MHFQLMLVIERMLIHLHVHLNQIEYNPQFSCVQETLFLMMTINL